MKDIILPFLLDEYSFRGKIAKLADSINDIVNKHNYPNQISKILCDLITSCTMIGDNLKSGILTIQLKSNGIINLIIVDYYDCGKIRAYAHWDHEKFQDIANDANNFRKLIGDGTIAVTIDQSLGVNLYQGIVKIQGETIDDLLSAYFTQSEQTDTLFKIFSSYKDGCWSSGGIMLQKMPISSSEVNFMSIENSWEEASLFISSIKENELIGDLEPDVLLYRLFNNQNIIVYDAKTIKHVCRCSRERAFNILKTIPKEELSELKLDNQIDVTCQFCSKKEIFTEKDLNEL